MFPIAGFSAWITFIISVYGTVRIIWFACKSDDTNRYCGFQCWPSFVDFSYWLQVRLGSSGLLANQMILTIIVVFSAWLHLLVLVTGSNFFALGNKSGGFCEAVNCERSEQEGKFLFAYLMVPICWYPPPSKTSWHNARKAWRAVVPFIINITIEINFSSKVYSKSLLKVVSLKGS